jgi:hypothetical protein
MQAVAASPFAVLTAVVAPAILTNASSVLALGTSNRVARVVDRTRVVARELAGMEAGSSHYVSWTEQLERLQVRAQLLVRALRLFYVSLGLFATSALIAVLGSAIAVYGRTDLLDFAAGVGLLAGAVAVGGLAWGCALMVHETRLAVRNLAEEAKIQNYRP